jgi:hypothetical protein
MYKLQQLKFCSYYKLLYIFHNIHTHTHIITSIKINFHHLYVKLPHNAQQETKRRERGFSIIYKQNENPHSQEWIKYILHTYFPK